jgi:nitroreductase
MNVLEALEKRSSIRAFLSDSVDKAILEEILEAASRTPSWANSQPWECYMAIGESVERIRKAAEEKYASAAPAAPEAERPKEWPESAKARQRQLGPDMQRDCGEAASQFGELNRKLFNAPALLVVAMDKAYGEWGMYDVGAYTQSVMLAAVEKGLGTIPAINIVLYPDILRKELGIADSQKIVIGIAIGYVDHENAINRLHTSRSPLSETVRYIE